RPGLEWSFSQLGIETGTLDLVRLDPVYEVTRPDAPDVTFFADEAPTAAAIDRSWPGAGARYERMVRGCSARYRALQPLLRMPNPRAAALRNPSSWRALPFVMRSLEQVMRAEQLPEPVVDALTIWTHVAALTRDRAPSTMALVPALVHDAGAWRPRR